MIKLFRKIRQNMLLDGKLGKYLSYAIGELLLVVIGILIALQLNNLNEERKVNNVRQEYYLQILEDIETDKKYIQEISLIIDSNLVNYRIYQKAYEEANLSIDQIRSNLIKLNWMHLDVQFQTNTIRTLQNTGDIQIIPSILRKKLIDLSRSQEQSENSSHQNNAMSVELVNHARKYFGSTGFGEIIKNQSKLLKWTLDENHQIELIVSLEASMSQKILSEKISLNWFKRILSEMDDITSIIREELKG